MKQITYIFILFILGLSSCDYVSEIRFKEAIINGNQLADSGKHLLAIAEFNDAQSYNDSSYISYYNTGNSLLKLHLLDSSSFIQSLALSKTYDSLNSSKIYYQLGNINLTRHLLLENVVNNNLSYIDSVKQEENLAIQERIRINIATDSLLKTNDSILKNQSKILQTAKRDYINSLSQNHLNDSAQYNYIYTLHLIKKEEDSRNNDKKDEEKKEPTKFALKKKEEAINLIKKNQFKKAYNILNDALQTDETVKNFNELIEKLKDVTEIIEKNEQ